MTAVETMPDLSTLGAAPLARRFMTSATQFEASRGNPEGGWRQAWDDVITELRSWATSGDLAEDDFDPPSMRSVIAATQLARAMQSAQFPPPTCIVPTGEGGLALDRRQGDTLQQIEISENGEIEQSVFADGRLVARYRMTLS
jgi:hypothetical protein